MWLLHLEIQPVQLYNCVFYFGGLESIYIARWLVGAILVSAASGQI